MENPNGQNEVKIIVPCCNDEELEIIYKAKDNKLASSVFKMMSDRVGIQVSFSEPKKGGD